MTDTEVERIAELCWRTLNLAVRGSYAWPGDCAYPDNWRAVARAVLADRAAHPPVTDGPTLMEAIRERDEALAEAKRTAAECDNAVADARRERDAARTRAVTAERERDDAQREIALLRDQVRQEQQNQDDYLKDHVAEVTRLRDRAANDALGPANAGRVFVIFDGPPSHESGRFVEVEDENGQSLNAGTWIHRLDGLWSLGPFYLTAQEPPANRVGSDQDAAIMSAVSVAPAPTYDPRYVNPHACRVCGRAGEAHEPWCRLGPAAPEPTLSPADTLDGAEEMLRRIAASACLDLDATEAAAIVAELDRLRAERAAMSARATVAETRHAAESEHLIAHGRSVERAAIVAWLRDCAEYDMADRIERGDHLAAKEPQP